MPTGDRMEIDMKNTEEKKTPIWRKIMPTKRRLIQLYTALLFNAYLKGYITGEIFKGVTKNVCTPGLNCYSCPGAVTACPLGALQNAFASSGKTAPYYMLGIILIYCITLGRTICGWICPFGLVQDLLHKIKTPKLKKSPITRVLSYFKYVVLVLFVVVFPLLYVVRDLPLPAFCKYICPAGTFGGALGLLINPLNESVFGMLGPLFTWKFILMVSFLVAAVFIYRVFCRFVCPLGALYGLFNRFALLGIKLDRSACTDCGKCVEKCKMDIREVGDHECIQCGECIDVCPTKAISWKGKKIILPDNEINQADGELSVCDASASYTVKIDAKTLVTKKRSDRVKNLITFIRYAMAVVIFVALVYFNFFHQNSAEAAIPQDPDSDIVDEELAKIPFGYEVGERCPTMSLELVGGGDINISELRGKTVVINFWGTWCGPCKAELPHFNELAAEYKEDVVFLIIHTNSNRDTAPEYIDKNFSGSEMIFAYDVPLDENTDVYFNLLGGTFFYPRTLVLDDRGVISHAVDSTITYDELKAEIEKTLK